jgi:hypothetical protein
LEVPDQTLVQVEGDLSLRIVDILSPPSNDHRLV